MSTGNFARHVDRVATNTCLLSDLSVQIPGAGIHKKLFMPFSSDLSIMSGISVQGG